MYKTILLSLFLMPLCLWAQNQKVTISGYIKDGSTGEDLIGATALATDLDGVGTTTNIYGFYSLTMPAGEHQVAFQYLGYQVKILNLRLE